MRKIILIGVVLSAIIGVGGWWLVSSAVKQAVEAAEDNLDGGEISYEGYQLHIWHRALTFKDVEILYADRLRATMKRITLAKQDKQIRISNAQQINLYLDGGLIGTIESMAAEFEDDDAHITAHMALNGARIIDAAAIPPWLRGVGLAADIDVDYALDLGDGSMSSQIQAQFLAPDRAELQLAMAGVVALPLADFALNYKNTAINSLEFYYEDMGLFDRGLAFYETSRDKLAENVIIPALSGYSILLNKKEVRKLYLAIKASIEGNVALCLVANADKPLTIEAIESLMESQGIGGKILEKILGLKEIADMANIADIIEKNMKITNKNTEGAAICG